MEAKAQNITKRKVEDKENNMTEEAEKVENKEPKIWKRLGIYDTYDDASVVKTQTLMQSPEGTLIKIKRCGPRGEKFQVKQWLPTSDKKSRKKSKRSK